MSDLLPLPTPGSTPVRVLTIAGSDSGGGAGIQADLRTMALLGVHGCVCITAVTAQNSLGVNSFHTIPPHMVAEQIDAVVSDIGVSAAKTAMVATAPIIEAIVDSCNKLDIGQGKTIPLVVDPVAASMHGDSLLATTALKYLQQHLIPQATLITPNLDEVHLLTGITVTNSTSQHDAAKAFYDLGAQWTLIKAGHLSESSFSTDLLYDGENFIEFPTARVNTRNDHGGGDTLAAAITCALGHGYSITNAVEYGKKWVTQCLQAAYPLGAGHGPVSPLWRLQ
ncbi:MAG: bifunctional hydroxymethylpyrimidine kinase/phosphomethylpyrimidine kinase [Mycobacteriaceae bacterium]